MALGSFVGMIAEGSTESSLGQNAASFVLYLLASSLWIAIGVLGLIATWDLQAIVNLAHQASAQAERYYKANLFGFAVIVFLTVIGIIMSTVSVVAGKIIVDGQVVQRNTSQQILAVIWVWLVAVFSLAMQAYFLYVVWSYKTKLVAAYAGRPFGTFVVKDQSPVPLVSINGAAPAGAPMVPMTHKHPINMYEAHGSPPIPSSKRLPPFLNSL